MASDAYDAIAQRLHQKGFNLSRATLAGAEALVGRRSEFAVSAKVHEFVVVFKVERLSAEHAGRLADAAQHHAIKHKGGLPRGLRTGTATIVVFLDDHAQDSAVQWVDRSPVHRFAAMRFVALFDTTACEVVYWRGQWTRGGAFRQLVLDLVNGAIIEPLGELVGGSNAKLRERSAPGSERDKIAEATVAAKSATRHTCSRPASNILPRALRSRAGTCIPHTRGISATTPKHPLGADTRFLVATAVAPF